MKWVRKILYTLLAFTLGMNFSQAIASAKSTAQSSAKAKAKATTKAKLNAKAKIKARVKAGKVSRPKASALSSRLDPADESSLDAEVAAARRILAGKPHDVEAQGRLARASVILVDWLLRAEAVGDQARAQHLTGKLNQDLSDTGSRVLTMSEQGDLMARQAAGFFLGRGMLLKRDSAKSCTEFLAAAEKLAPAGWHAAQCLTETSPESARMQMERAAQRGHGAALEWMGRRCLGEFGGSQKDFLCARNYFIQSASLGRPSAQTLLAFLLATGQGGPVDVSRAVRLYKAAAEKGDANAQNNLGEIYETGRGVTRDLPEAIGWYESAAKQGLGSAQYNAGRLWAIGVGSKKDTAKARALLAQAEINGVPQARQVLDWLDRQLAQPSDEAPGLKPSIKLGDDTARE